MLSVEILLLNYFVMRALRGFGVGLVATFAVSLPLSVATADEQPINPAKTIEASASVSEPSIFIEELVDKLRTLAESDQADDDRMDSLRLVLSEDMATNRLQRYLLSSEHRKSLSEEEMDQYNEIFPLYISSAFAGSIDELVSRQIKVQDVIERRPGDYIVRSKLYSSDGQERAGLDWRVREQNGRKLLVDVMIDGLSFSVERRAQFTSVIKRDGFDALLVHMKETAGETTEAAELTE